MDIDFSASARAVALGFSQAESEDLQQHVRALSATLEVGRQRMAIFDVGPHLVSCTFERTPQRLVVSRLRRLPPRRPTPP